MLFRSKAVIAAVHIPQAPPDGNADLAAVYALHPGNFGLVDTGDVVEDRLDLGSSGAYSAGPAGWQY